MLKYDCCMITDVGRVRTNNEDNFYFNGNYKRAVEQHKYEKQDLIYKGGVFAVCDGMGGEEFGEKASLYAVETLNKYKDDNFSQYISRYIEEANDKICSMIELNNGMRSGTTLALVDITDGKAISCNIGDSRVYLYRKGKLMQLSEDHTRTAQMVKAGILTEEQAATHRDRHVLTQHLGIFTHELCIEPYIAETVDIMVDDIFLLCSDGLTDMLTDMEIEQILSLKHPASQLAGLLVSSALEKGGKDNVTVGVIKTVGRKNNLFKKIFWGVK